VKGSMVKGSHWAGSEVLAIKSVKGWRRMGWWGVQVRWDGMVDHSGEGGG